MSAARMVVRSWMVRLGGVVAQVATARLRWCVVCGRVGLVGWQPLCAAMPITWVCADRAGCRDRQVVEALRRERGWRRLVLWGRPGPARPPTGRPWHQADLADPGALLDGSQSRRGGGMGHGEAVGALAAGSETQADDPADELAVLVHPRPHAASRRAGGRR